MVERGEAEMVMLCCRGGCYGEIEKTSRMRDCSSNETDSVISHCSRLLRSTYTCLWADMRGVSPPAGACQGRTCEQTSGQPRRKKHHL
jgi:hypothetical protein